MSTFKEEAEVARKNEPGYNAVMDINVHKLLERVQEKVAKTPQAKLDKHREDVALRGRHALVKEMVAANVDDMHREVEDLKALYLENAEVVAAQRHVHTDGGDVVVVDQEATWRTHTMSLYANYDKAKMQRILKFIEFAIAYADHTAEVLNSLVVRGVLEFKDLAYFLTTSEPHPKRVSTLIGMIFMAGKSTEQVVAALDVIVRSYRMLHAVMVDEGAFECDVKDLSVIV